MPDYTFTMPDGSVFDATAGTWEEAHKAVKTQIEQDRIDAAKKEFADAPITSKARMIVDDPMRNIVHGLTAGLFDKAFDYLTGGNQAAQTQAASDRLGPTGTAVSRGVGAVMLPSAVPKAVAAVGGGPLVRGLVGAGTAGAEGGVYGGVNAATSGEDVPTGVLAGAIGGAAGQTVAQSIGQNVNKAIKYAKNIDDAAPKNSMSVLPTGRAPTPTDYVNVAANRAASTGAKRGSAEATQQAQRDAFEKLLVGKDSKVIDPATGKASDRFTKTQQARMGDIVYGDPGTRGTEVVGDLLKNKLLAGGLGGGVGATTGVVPGLLASGATMGTGKLLTVDSAKATQEAVDRLRQLMYKKQPFKGPMSPDRIRTIGQGLGYGGMTGIEDYLGD